MNEINAIQAPNDQRIGIVVADFNSVVTTALLTGAVQRLRQDGVAEANITVLHVPGALELSRMVKQLATSQSVDGIIALGAVVRGATSHYDYVCQEAASGLAQVSLNGPVPVMFGVLTTDTLDQAIDRAGGKSGNKGVDCADGVMQMLSVEAQVSELAQ